MSPAVAHLSSSACSGRVGTGTSVRRCYCPLFIPHHPGQGSSPGQSSTGQSTVGDVLGTRQATIDPLPYLAGTLPYSIKTRSQTHSDLPASRQAHFKYEIYADARSAAWGESSLLSWKTPAAAIAGKKITLAWVAASTADEAAIAALIPKPAPGQQLDPSQLPRGLPSSISLKPQILVDGTGGRHRPRHARRHRTRGPRRLHPLWVTRLGRKAFVRAVAFMYFVSAFGLLLGFAVAGMRCWVSQRRFFLLYSRLW